MSNISLELNLAVRMLLTPNIQESFVGIVPRKIDKYFRRRLINPGNGHVGLAKVTWSISSKDIPSSSSSGAKKRATLDRPGLRTPRRERR